jgi:nucleotide-binding universal stress UspA family protein
MTHVVTAVRYPLTEHSTTTLERAVEVATDRDAQLTVVHVKRYQDSGRVTRAELKRAVEEELWPLSRTRYVVRTGLLVEETLLDEIATLEADVAVIGGAHVSNWRQMIRRLVEDPAIESYLRTELDCDVITVAAPETA